MFYRHDWIRIPVALETVVLGDMGVESGKIMIGDGSRRGSRVAGSWIAGSFCLSNKVNAESQELRCS